MVALYCELNSHENVKGGEEAMASQCYHYLRGCISYVPPVPRLPNKGAWALDYAKSD